MYLRPVKRTRLTIGHEALVTRGLQLTGLALLAGMLAIPPTGEAAARGGGSGGSHSGKGHSGGHHNHRSGSNGSFGTFWTAGYWPWWYYPPYYQMADMPVAYIERSEEEARDGPYWLYCAKTQDYYPYVGECAEGWQRVPTVPFQ